MKNKKLLTNFIYVLISFLISISGAYLYFKKTNINPLATLFPEEKGYKARFADTFNEQRTSGLFKYEANSTIKSWLLGSFNTISETNSLGYSDEEFNFSDEDKIEEKRIFLKIPNSEKDLIYNKSFILNYNFENINSLSFNKGCYIGQENTARQKFRGTQKYSLQRIKIIDGMAPKLNEDIFYNNLKIGTMKSSSAEFCLCLIRNDTIKNDTNQITTDTNFTFKIL